MLKSEFDQMTLDEVIDWASENLDDLTTEESLLEYQINIFFLKQQMVKLL